MMVYRWLGRLIFVLFYPFWRLTLTGSKRAYVIFICPDNRILFVRNWLDNGRWHLPGGGLKPGETYHSGLVREVWEELKIKLEPSHVKRLINGSHRGYDYTVYSCRLDQMPTLTPNRREIVAVQWLDRGQQLALETPAALALQHLNRNTG